MELACSCSSGARGRIGVPMAACNAFTAPVSAELAAMARKTFDDHVKSNLDEAWELETIGGSIPSDEMLFYYTRPSAAWKYRLQWVYSNNKNAFEHLEVRGSPERNQKR